MAGGATRPTCVLWQRWALLAEQAEAEALELDKQPKGYNPPSMLRGRR